MADKKISELTEAGALTGAELVEIVQGGVNKQSTTQDIADLGGGGGTWGSITGTLSSQTDLQSALDAKQPIDSDLTAIAALTPSNDDILQRKAGVWTNRTLAQIRTDLATPKVIQLACSDEVTPITATANKIKFRMPYAMTLTAVRASLSTTQTSGSIFTVDINEGVSSILSTKLTIDNGATTSTTATTPAVISDTALADDAEISIDVDQIGDNTAKGLKVTLIGV